MWMDREGDVRDRGAHLDREGELADQVARVRAYERRAEEDVRRRIREELHEAVGLPGRQGPTDGGKRHLPDSDLPTLGGRLGLLQPDGRNLGIGEDGRRQGAVVIFSGMSREHLLSGTTFLRFLLCQSNGRVQLTL